MRDDLLSYLPTPYLVVPALWSFYVALLDDLSRIDLILHAQLPINFTFFLALTSAASAISDPCDNKFWGASLSFTTVS